MPGVSPLPVGEVLDVIVVGRAVAPLYECVYVAMKNTAAELTVDAV